MDHDAARTRQGGLRQPTRRIRDRLQVYHFMASTDQLKKRGKGRREPGTNLPLPGTQGSFQLGLDFVQLIFGGPSESRSNARTANLPASSNFTRPHLTAVDTGRICVWQNETHCTVCWLVLRCFCPCLIPFLCAEDSSLMDPLACAEAPNLCYADTDFHFPPCAR